MDMFRSAVPVPERLSRFFLDFTGDEAVGSSNHASLEARLSPRGIEYEQYSGVERKEVVGVGGSDGGSWPICLMLFLRAAMCLYNRSTRKLYTDLKDYSLVNEIVAKRMASE